MSELEKEILSALVDTGRAKSDWRFKVQSIEILPYSDWATIVGVLTKKKHRKPCMCWELACYIPKKQIWWDKSVFVRLAE